MYFWQSFKTWFINNKEDVLAVFVISFIITAILCSYTFNTVAPQEGWYSIYARNILQDGLVPYRDFFLVVPPIFLYIWTIWQAIFGDNFIVFHYLNFLFQISCAVSFYFLFKQVFNKKIAFVTALFLTIIKMFIEWDNGYPSYNILAFTFMALMALFTIKQIDYIRTYKQISNKFLWLIGAIFAISFLNKQTNGPLTIIASCSMLMAVSYSTLGFKKTVKHFIQLFLISMLFVFILLLPLLLYGAIPSMINALFFNDSKGSAFILIMKALILPFPISCWPWYIIVTILFCIMIRKVDLFCWETKLQNFTKYLITVLIIFTALLFISKTGFFYNQWAVHFIDRIVCYFLFSGFSVCLFINILIFCYLTDQWIKNKELSNRKIFLLAIIPILIIGHIADAMSNVVTFPQFYAIVLGLLLMWKWKKLNIVKNIFIYVFIVCAVFTRFVYKLQQPMHFYWQSGDVLGELSESFIPRLKGMKIPIEEKNMYEKIYNIVHKYTSKDDKILAFNNNTAFYDLTERKPYTQYVSLYHDVSPDNQSLEVLEQIKNNLPKVIIFNKLSDRVETQNEGLFRGKGIVSGQRQLRDYITSLQEREEYITVQEYKIKADLDVGKVSPDLMPLVIQLQKPIQEAERAKILETLTPYIKIKNQFLEKDTELYVLVRKDVFLYR